VADAAVAPSHLMRHLLSSRIMRTTVDIDDPILREIRRLHEQEGRSMGAVISELLADALSRRRGHRSDRTAFRWTAQAMRARVDLDDKDALHAALDDDRR
jgi:hypothetical protein